MTSPAQSAESPSWLLVTTCLVYGLAVALLLLGQWKPLAFHDVGHEAWVFALSEAAAGRYRFGNDIVFTSGPLSDFYKHLFNPATFRTALVLDYCVLTLQAVAITVIAKPFDVLLFRQ